MPRHARMPTWAESLRHAKLRSIGGRGGEAITLPIA
jgi:hypothetical protein